MGILFASKIFFWVKEKKKIDVASFSVGLNLP